IASPAPSGFTTGTVDVVGSVADDHLVSWSLTDRFPDGSSRTIATGNGPVNGALGSLRDAPEGAHLLTLHAKDAAANESDLTVPFTVDRTAPLIAFVSPLDGDRLSAASAPIRVVASLAEAHPKLVRLQAATASGTRTLFEGAFLADG